MTQPAREVNFKIRFPRLARGRRQVAANLLGAGLAVGWAYVQFGTGWALFTASVMTFALGFASESGKPREEGQR